MLIVRSSMPYLYSISELFCLIFVVDYAVMVAHYAVFSNASQQCTAGSRTFVHAKLYDQFIAKSIELATNRVLGDPFDAMTEQGPQVNHFAKREKNICEYCFYR